MNLITGLIRLAVCVWLGWIAFMLYAMLWMDLPLLAGALTAVVVGLFVRRITRKRRLRTSYIQRRAAAKAEHYKHVRVQRALTHPNLVWDENARDWERELTS